MKTPRHLIVELNAEGSPGLGELTPDFDVVRPVRDVGGERWNGRTRGGRRDGARFVDQHRGSGRGDPHGGEEAQQFASTDEVGRVVIVWCHGLSRLPGDLGGRDLPCADTFGAMPLMKT